MVLKVSIQNAFYLHFPIVSKFMADNIELFCPK